MDAQPWNTTRKVLEEGLDQEVFPGVVLAVANSEKTLLLKAEGFSRVFPDKRNMCFDDLFDLASLTKPVATATTVLRLVQHGFLSLDQNLTSFFVDWPKSSGGQITVRHLLTHTSGLPAWFPTYVRAKNKNEVLKVIFELEQAYEPGTQVEYSCLGFIVLGLLIEQATGLSLNQASTQFVFEPLDMKETVFLPLVHLDFDQDRLVLNEADSVIEKNMVHRAGLSFGGWREGYDSGKPNDGNACYALGGVSGNAGLFSTAPDLLTFGQSWLGALQEKRRDFLVPSLAKMAISNMTAGLNAARGLGWVVHTGGLVTGQEIHVSPSMKRYVPSSNIVLAKPRSSGEMLSKHAFGHTGFTGTSLWIDPQKDLVIVLLTNHLHAKGGQELGVLRARLHNAIVADLGF